MSARARENIGSATSNPFLAGAGSHYYRVTSWRVSTSRGALRAASGLTPLEQHHRVCCHALAPPGEAEPFRRGGFHAHAADVDAEGGGDMGTHLVAVRRQSRSLHHHDGVRVQQ